MNGATVKKKALAILIAMFCVMAFGAESCDSAAKTADENLTKACDNFECPRRITGINGITDKVLFVVEGFCSYQIYDNSYQAICLRDRESGAVERITLGKSDNVTMLVTQLNDVEVDLFRPRVIFRPETVVPNFDLSTSGNPTEP